MAVTTSITDLPNNRRLVKATIQSTGSVQANDIFDGPANVLYYHAINSHSADVYLNFYDDINPTVGSTAPDYSREIPASGTNGGQRAEMFDDNGATGTSGWETENGVSIAVVAGPGTANSTNPSANCNVAVYAVMTGAS